MRTLIDTNIFLEIILDQEKAKESIDFLKTIERTEYYISDFSLHSIGLYLFRKEKYKTYNEFLSDMINNSSFELASLSPEDLTKLSKNVKEYNLDFDDAYQYVAAEKYELQIISFDSDFDNTRIGRKTPGEILSEYNNQENDGS